MSGKLNRTIGRRLWLPDGLVEYFGPKEAVFGKSDAISVPNQQPISESEVASVRQRYDENAQPSELPQHVDAEPVSGASPRMSGDNEADLMLDQLHLPRRKRSGSFSAARPISFDQVRSTASNNQYSAILFARLPPNSCAPLTRLPSE